MNGGKVPRSDRTAKDMLEDMKCKRPRNIAKRLREIKRMAECINNNIDYTPSDYGSVNEYASEIMRIVDEMLGEFVVLDQEQVSEKQSIEIVDVIDTAESYRTDFTMQFRNKIRELLKEAFEVEDFCDKLFLPFNQSKDGFTYDEQQMIELFAVHCRNLSQAIKSYFDVNAKRNGNLVVRKAEVTSSESETYKDNNKQTTKEDFINQTRKLELEAESVWIYALDIVHGGYVKNVSSLNEFPYVVERLEDRIKKVKKLYEKVKG